MKCILVIDPGLGSTLPTALPPGMSARFRVGMSLAQACQVRHSYEKNLFLRPDAFSFKNMNKGVSTQKNNQLFLS